MSGTGDDLDQLDLDVAEQLLELPGDLEREYLADQLDGVACLRPAGVARAWGIPINTVRSWLRQGKLPRHRVNGVCLIKVADLRELLDQGRGKRRPAPPIKAA